MNELVRKWRQEVKMTQEGLAKLLFLTPQAVSLLENGKRNMSFELFRSIAKVFGKEIHFSVEDKLIMKEIVDESTEKESLEEFLRKDGNELIQITKEDFETIMSVQGKSYFTKSSAETAKEAIEDSLRYLQMHKVSLEQAKGILFFIEGASNFDFDDLDCIYKTIEENTNKEALRIFGCNQNNKEESGIVLRVLAAGL